MKEREALGRLKAAGTAQNRKVYARHGITGPAHGVSYADLGKLRREIGTDHALAIGLWKSGNHDARVLATMVADPARMSSRDLDAWSKDLDSYPLTDAFAGLAAGSDPAVAKMKRWIRSPREFVGSAGWGILAHLAGRDGVLTDAFLLDALDLIERRIAGAANRTRYSMNSALIAIGGRGGALRTKALATARRIGPVEVDHGETGCKTPDAVAYIERVVAHRSSRRRKKA